MPGIEIKGRSKIANYRHGGRAGFAHGFSTVKKFAKQYHKKKKLAQDTKKGKFPETESLTHQKGPYVGDVGSEKKGKTDWITKKDKPTEWITKKDKPTEWITKKGKTDWITKKDKPTEWITKKPDWPKRPKWEKPIGKFPPKEGRVMEKPIGKFPPEEGRKMQPLKKGGKSDKKWIQKAVDPKHKGYCTPMTKKTCTPARKALARTFKKKAKTGWG